MSESNESSIWATWLKTTHMAITFAFPFLTMFVGWIANATIENSKDLAAVKANRYTASDAKADQQALTAEVNQLGKSIYALDKRIPDQIPPKWFLDKITAMEDDVKTLRRDVSAIREDRMKQFQDAAK